MATLQEMMEWAERIGLQGQEVADFIREQQEQPERKGGSKEKKPKGKELMIWK